MKQILPLLLLLICSTIVADDFQYTYKGKTLTYTILDEKARTCKLKDGHYYGTPGTKYQVSSSFLHKSNTDAITIQSRNWAHVPSTVAAS